MPLQGEQLAREPREDGVGCRSLGEEDRQEPDLGLGARNDLAAEARGEELNAKAGAEEGQAGPNRLGNQGLLGPEPGELVLRR